MAPINTVSTLKIGDQYMHSFGAVGTPINGVPFTDLWLSSASELNLGHLNEYSATAIAAYENKFHPPVAGTQGAQANHFFPLTNLQYAYQLPILFNILSLIRLGNHSEN